MRVLIADDSALSRRILTQRLSEWGYEVLTCADGTEAVRILLGDDPPALAVLDWDMPGKTGIEVCHQVREAGREPYTYLLILTANQAKGALIEGLQSGADDFLRKPFDDEELHARLRTGQRMADLQADLIATRERLRVQVTHDALTGLWSRGAILEFFEREVARAHREKRMLAAALIDLDPFSLPNTASGQMTRDAVVRAAGNRIRAALRTYDTVGRHGGEQFLVVVPGCDADIAIRRADQIREALGKKPLELQGTTLAVTCSLGLVVGPNGGEADPGHLLQRASDALQRAKKQRDRVEMATS